MDFHPILERGDAPAKALWYVISAPNPPTPRVGQACTCSKSSTDNCNVYIVGGADPSTTHKEVYKFDVNRFTWTQMKPAGFVERYEHCAMTSSDDPDKIYLFGGANQSSNLSTSQVFDKSTKKCQDVDCDGHIPKARTSHSAATNGKQLFVWGGGHMGTEPVTDLSLHVLDVTTSTWKRYRLKDEVPTARLGHVLELVNDKIYIHGGMAGTTLHNELYSITLDEYSSTRLKPQGNIPSSRAGHSTCSYKDDMYIFGGLTIHGPSNEMFQYNTVSNQWNLLNFDSPPPTPRLDHSTVVTYLRCKEETSTDENGTTSSSAAPPKPVSSPRTTQQQPATTTTTTSSSNGATPHIIPVDLWEIPGGDAQRDVNQAVERLTLADESSSDVEDETDVEEGGRLIPVFMVFGGMDVSGNIYNDLLVTRLDQLSTSPSTTS